MRKKLAFSFCWQNGFLSYKDRILIKLYFRPYHCKYCDVKYYRKYQLVKHLSSKHPGAAASESEFDNDVESWSVDS